MAVIEVLALACPANQQPFSCYDTTLEATETAITPQMCHIAKYRVLLVVTFPSHLFKFVSIFHSLNQCSMSKTCCSSQMYQNKIS